MPTDFVVIQIKKVIENIAYQIPVKWDRFTNEGYDYNIYGWLSRKDGQRDFILLQLYWENGDVKGSFVTSSAKYSEQLHKILYDKEEGHVGCKKIECLQ